MRLASRFGLGALLAAGLSLGAPAISAASSPSEDAARLIMRAGCMECHSAGGAAEDTRLVFPPPNAPPEAVKTFTEDLLDLVDPDAPERSRLLRKPTRIVKHEGGQKVVPGTADESILRAWVADLARAHTTDTATQVLTAIARPVLTGTRVWLLSPRQYQETVARALGVPVDVTRMAVTERLERFLNPARNGLQIDGVFFTHLEEVVSQAVAANREHLFARLPCAIDKLDRRCLHDFLRGDYGRVLFRVPASSFDFERYLRLFDKLARPLGRRRAFESVVVATLLSPKALFRYEIGGASQPGDAARVTLASTEVAESLAYTIWNAPPDEELMTLAETGALADPKVVTSQIDRLMSSADRYAGISQFLTEWLGLATFRGVQKNKKLFPQWNDDLRASMLAETERFIAYVLGERNGSLLDLLSLQASFLDKRLAPVYGIDAGEVTADGLTPLPKDQRIGVFTQPAVIAAMSEASLTGFVYRGKVMLEKLLCRHVEAADMNVEFPVLKTLPQEATTRQRMEPIEKLDACASCHQVLHPIAFAMETYDAIGRHRTTEKNKPIDTHGRLAFSKTAGEPFHDAVEMLGMLAKSDEVHHCFVRQAFRYVFGRSDEPGDVALIDRAYGAFKDSQLDIRHLFRTLVASEAFTLRTRR